MSKSIYLPGVLDTKDYELAYQPVEPAPYRAGTRRARTALRHDPSRHGTFLLRLDAGEFLLANSHLGDAEGWLKDWSNVRPSHYTRDYRHHPHHHAGGLERLRSGGEPAVNQASKGRSHYPKPSIA